MKTCVICEQPFTPASPTAYTCSVNCRKVKDRLAQASSIHKKRTGAEMTHAEWVRRRDQILNDNTVRFCAPKKCALCGERFAPVSSLQKTCCASHAVLLSRIYVKFRTALHTKKANMSDKEAFFAAWFDYYTKPEYAGYTDNFNPIRIAVRDLGWRESLNKLIEHNAMQNAAKSTAIKESPEGGFVPDYTVRIPEHLRGKPTYFELRGTRR